MEIKKLKVELTFIEEVLGTASSDPAIHESFIASKAPDAMSLKEEVEALGVEEVEKKQMTIFSRNEEGQPIMWDYQVKGFFKDACGMLRKATGSESSKIKAYKKEIDGLIFIEERQIPYIFDGEMGNCQRSLRASTPQGERISLANSETIPAGAKVIFTINILNEKLLPAIKEWLTYGQLRGTGQWRNSGKGKFTWKEM